MIYEFSVFGSAATKGSTRSFVSHSTRKVVTIADNRRLPEFTKLIQIAAKWARVKLTPKPHPVTMSITWTFIRPKREQKRPHHTVKPDIDKLERAVLDALTGIAYDDDAQVTTVVKHKQYGDEERTDITVRNEGEA